MFRAILLAASVGVACLTSVSPGYALEWFTESDDGSITTAAFEGPNSIEITCAAGELTFAVRVRQSELAAPIAAADPVYVRTTSDPAADGSTPSFTSRATVDVSGPNPSFVLNAKDSAARIGAFSSAKAELEFSLMTEPGGERFNTFRLPVAGAQDALGEVLAACSGPAEAPAASSEPPPTPSPVAETAPPPADTAPPPPPKKWSVGPGDIADSQWHFVADDAGGRTFAYKLDGDGRSLTFECSRTFLGLTVGLPVSSLHPDVADRARTNLVIDGTDRWVDETTSRMVQGDTAFYSLAGASAKPVIRQMASAADSTEVVIGFGPPNPVDSTPADKIVNRATFAPGAAREVLLKVMDACAVSAPPVRAKMPQWKLPLWRLESGGDTASVSSDISADGGFVMVRMRCSPRGAELVLTIPKSNHKPANFARGTAGVSISGSGLGLSKPLQALEGPSTIQFSMETADAAEVLSAISQQAVSELTFDIVSGPSSGTVARIVTGNDGLQSGLAEVLRRCPGGMQEDPAVEEVPVAQDGVWSFGPDETGLPNARVVVGDSRLIFTCYEGDIFFEYDFPKLHPDLSGLSSVAVAFGIDPSPNGWSPAIVSGTPISEGGGTYLTLFSGPAAIEWANAVRRANRVIKVAITQPDRGSEFKLYNITEFPAKGSTAAIKELQASCS